MLSGRHLAPLFWVLARQLVSYEGVARVSNNSNASYPAIRDETNNGEPGPKRYLGAHEISGTERNSADIHEVMGKVLNSKVLNSKVTRGLENALIGTRIGRPWLMR